MQTYPTASVFLVLGLGVVLALISPKKAFLTASFGLSSLNLSTAFFTRTVWGAYFNLVDAFVVVLVFALGLHFLIQRQSVVFPKVLGWILAIWLLAFLVGGFNLGFRYEVIREARWSLNFIIGFFVCANFVTDRTMAEHFSLSIVLGAIAAATQHISGTVSGVITPTNNTLLEVQLASVRNIGFLFSPISYLLGLTLIQRNSEFFQHIKIGTKFTKLITILLLASVLLNQTRSQWIAVVVGTLAVALVTNRTAILGKSVLALSVLLLLSSPVLRHYLPAMDPVSILTTRYTTLVDDGLRMQTTVTRQNQIRVELDLWQQSGPIGWLLGQGFAFRWADNIVAVYGSRSSEGERVAWGHIGYIAYLSNLGILGFIVYGVYITASVARTSYNLLLNGVDESFKLIALLALLAVIINAVTFSMSASYLQPELIVVGLIYGSVYGIVRGQRNE